MSLLGHVSSSPPFLNIASSNQITVLRSWQFVFEKIEDEERSVVEFSWNFYGAIFNEDDFESAPIDPTVIELGERLTEQKSSDAYLPSLASSRNPV